MLSHEQSVMIRFGDADAAGVVFYPRALELAHGVVEEMIRGSALGWAGWFASPEHAAPLRHAEADFLRPMAAGKLFTARARVDRIGESSVTFVVDFLGDSGETAASVTTTHVLVAKGTGQPVSLGPELRRALQGVSRPAS